MGTLRSRARLVEALVDAGRAGAPLEPLLAANHGLSDARLIELVASRFEVAMRSDLEEARHLAAIAGCVAPRVASKRSRATALRLDGLMHHLGGDARVASRQLASAAKIHSDEGEFLTAGDVERILIDVAVARNDERGALRAYRAARRLYRRGGGAGPRRLGGLELNLGHLHHRRDRLARAMEHYNRARRHFRRADDALRVANADFSRANILASQDRTAAARTLLDASRATFASTGHRHSVAKVDRLLAELDRLEGDLDRCAMRLAALRALRLSLGDALGAAHVDLEHGRVLARLNRRAEAEERLRLALAVFRKARLEHQCAQAEIALGSVLVLDDRTAARRLWKRARGRAASEPNPLLESRCDLDLALLDLPRDPTSALQAARRARRRFERAVQPRRIDQARVVEAAALIELDRHARAETLLDRAIHSARRRQDARTEFRAHELWASSWERRGEPTRAYRRLCSAERCAERMRGRLLEQESKLHFLEDKANVYERLVINRLERGDARSLRQALLWAERGRSRALVDLLRQWSRRADDPGPSAELLKRLDRIDRRLAVAEERSDGPRGIRRAALAPVLAARTRLLERIARVDRWAGWFSGATPPDPNRALEGLSPGDLVLDYIAADGAVHLLAVDRRGIAAHGALMSLRELADAVGRLRFQTERAALGGALRERVAETQERTILHVLELLSSRLLGPVAGRLGRYERVWIVPCGSMASLPVAALRVDGRFLVETHEVVTLPSLSALTLLRAESPPPADVPLVLGYSDELAPAIDREVEAVARRLDGARVYRGREATRRRLLEQRRQPSVSHIACHIATSARSPWRSGLRLADGWLDLATLFAIPRAGRIVVLSGCSSATSTVYSWDERLGLFKALFRAGAKAIVGSLWDVDDAATGALMTDLYETLGRGDSLASSLAQAQRAAIGRGLPTTSWAAFVINGDGQCRLEGVSA